MEPFHDIYRKENPPIISRRRRHRFPDVKNRATLGSQPESPVSSRRRRRHKHHSQNKQNEHANRILWLSLAAVFIIYVGFLAVSTVRSRLGKSEPVKQEEISAPPKPQESHAGIGEEIRNKLQLWAKLPDAVLEAQTFQDKNLADKAEERLNRALEQAPASLMIQQRLAKLYVQQGRYAEAEQILLRVLEANPNDIAIRLTLGSIYESVENYEAALSVAKWVMEVDANSVEANKLAANSHLNSERHALAVPHLRKLIGMERDNAAIKNKLAVAYTQMGQYVKAIQIFNELLASNTSDPMTYYNLAVCYSKQSMADQAFEVLVRARAIFGAEFVSSWIRNRDFDPVRGDPAFKTLLPEDEIAAEVPQLPSGKETAAETQAPVKEDRQTGSDDADELVADDLLLKAAQDTMEGAE